MIAASMAKTAWLETKIKELNEETMQQCPECSGTLFKEGMIKVNKEGKLICKDCYRENYF